MRACGLGIKLLKVILLSRCRVPGPSTRRGRRLEFWDFISDYKKRFKLKQNRIWGRLVGNRAPTVVGDPRASLVLGKTQTGYVKPNSVENSPKG
jgi:hypothetical protein